MAEINGRVPSKVAISGRISARGTVNGVVNVGAVYQGGGIQFRTDETLTLQDGVLSVNTTDLMEQDNTLPITSAGVYATIGNIEALLKTI